MAQSVGQPTLGFGLGHELGVMDGALHQAPHSVGSLLETPPYPSARDLGSDMSAEIFKGSVSLSAIYCGVPPKLRWTNGRIHKSKSNANDRI